MAYMIQQQQPQMPIMTQPVAQSVIVTAPTEPKSQRPNMGNKQNVYVWVSDECGCCDDCCICCYAFWCWPCFLCSLANAMDECSVGPWLCHTTPTACCCIHAFVPFHVNPFLFAMRSKLRAQYGIEGTICRDLVCVWCCEFCVATQMMRELKWYGRWR